MGEGLFRSCDHLVSHSGNQYMFFKANIVSCFTKESSKQKFAKYPENDLVYDDPQKLVILKESSGMSFVIVLASYVKLFIMFSAWLQWTWSKQLTIWMMSSKHWYAPVSQKFSRSRMKTYKLSLLTVVHETIYFNPVYYSNFECGLVTFSLYNVWLLTGHQSWPVVFSEFH